MSFAQLCGMTYP
ncbi:hypothetical protein QN277_018919 [Acacia crassicarpa]|uniref:Uncharacterized protein n=1 Tax=Acacia crassicarpa TaxID=499986 RepID=A0AAE1JXL3_9FABA|nr:hypothetical protein QN277_018919 [Acacia crassicarpa]